MPPLRAATKAVRKVQEENMVPVMSLWIPILVSAVVVFLASWVIHMALPYHRSDFRKLPAEDDVMEALRKFNLPPGDYQVPYAASERAMREPAYVEKRNKGPVAIMTVGKSGSPTMVQSLLSWLVYCMVVGVFAAYMAGRALDRGAPYLSVFRFAGCTAFTGYSLALLQNSIWYRRNWGATLKTMFDGLLYALLTAGVFGWLWPR